MEFFKNKAILILVAIILLAAVFRFFGLSRADVITDENLVGFRSIGYIDYFASPHQSTPFEWFDPEIPGWAHLSFHDHPPLFFILHFLFFSIFGVSVFVLRLPSVLAGIASVFLMYLAGKKLFGEKVGLAASAMMAITVYPVWISRIALQESLTIFFSLLAVYFFVRACWSKDQQAAGGACGSACLPPGERDPQESKKRGQSFDRLQDPQESKAAERDKFWLLAGAALGLGMLTKYTVIILAPVFILYLLIYCRTVFAKKYFYFGALIALILFLPVIIYNLKLYQAVGHFDLQFSYLLSQPTPEWQNLLGKPVGSYGERAIQLVANLRAGLTPTMFYGTILAAILFVWFWIKNKFKKEYTLLALILASYFLLLLLIGPQTRFLSLLMPWLLFMLAIIISQTLKIKNTILRLTTVGLLILCFGYEMFFSYNTAIAYYPIGEPGIDYAKPLKMDSFSWGFNQLDDYLEQLLKNKTPALGLPTKYQFLEKIKTAALARDEKEGKEKFSVLIIYDADMYDLATMWLFWRRAVYGGWPIITADLFLQQGQKFFTDAGVSEFYFIKATENVLLKEPAERTQGAAMALEDKLMKQGLAPVLIKNYVGLPMFKIYKFSL